MNWLLLAALLISAQSKDAERANAQANKRLRAERKAEVAAPVLPGATSTVQIPVTGTGTDAAGKKYTFAGTITLSIEDLSPPPPPPPPPGPTIQGIRQPGQTTFLSEAVSGQSLELVGSGLPTSGILRLQIAGQIATVQQWTPTLLSFTAPTVTQVVSGPIQVFVQVNNTWTLALLGSSFTLKPLGVTPVGQEPHVDQFLAADGTPKTDFKIKEPLTLVGVGFGQQTGRVLVNWLEVPTTAWSPTRIDTFAGDGGTAAGTKTFLEIKTPTGWLLTDGPLVHYP